MPSLTIGKGHSNEIDREREAQFGDLVGQINLAVQ